MDEVFDRLRQQQTAFMPFITAGDPNLEFTSQVIRDLDQAGCDFLELGFPYSDPIADGPVIQESYSRALSTGVSVDDVLQMTREVDVRMPIVGMISYALIYRRGPDQFISDAKRSGLAGAIVPDLPIDESDEFAGLCAKREFKLIQLVTPTTSERRTQKIIQQSTGFIYFVSVAGITGERSDLPADIVNRLTAMRQKTETPICVGFGISSPDQAERLKSHADGVIVGSAIIKRMAQIDEIGEVKCREQIIDFAKSMICKLKP